MSRLATAPGITGLNVRRLDSIDIKEDFVAIDGRPLAVVDFPLKKFRIQGRELVSDRLSGAPGTPLALTAATELDKCVSGHPNPHLGAGDA